MKNGISFEAALIQVSQFAGIEQLMQVQENTLVLTNKWYAIMKTTMKLSGTFSLACIATGTLLRILHVSGADIIFVTGFLSLTLCFFPAAVFLDLKRSVKKQWLRRIFLMTGCDLLAAGVLFKVMHWTGANMMLVIGWVIVPGIFLPLLLVEKLRETSSRKIKAIYLLGASALFIFEFATLFKLMHWPGTSIMLITGSILLVTCFLPLYSLMVIRHNQRFIPQFLFLVILSIYAVTMTSLISFRGTPTENDVVTPTSTLQIIQP
jgi:hypothetical protein